METLNSEQKEKYEKGINHCGGYRRCNNSSRDISSVKRTKRIRGTVGMKAVKVAFITIVSALTAVTALWAWVTKDKVSLEKISRVAGETC